MTTPLVSNMNFIKWWDVISRRTNPQQFKPDNGISKAINQCLKKNGISTDTDPQQKLYHLWRLFQQKEKQNRNLEENLGSVHKQRNSELSELESYVEHIRKISDDRESLITDCENENKELKAKLDGLMKNDTDSIQQDNINKLLIHQGLEDIANINVVEQMAYLLVERTHLMKDLEEERKKNNEALEKNNNDEHLTSESQLKCLQMKNLLEQERAEFDQELQHQQETMRQVKDEMNKIHEGEIDLLTKEKEELKEKLEDSWKKVMELSTELEQILQERPIQEVSLLEELEEKQQEITILKKEKIMLNEKLQKLEMDYQILQEQKSMVLNHSNDGSGDFEEKIVFSDVIESNNSQLETLKNHLKETEEEIKLQKQHFHIEEKNWKEKLSSLLEEIQRLCESLSASKEECAKLKRHIEMEPKTSELWNRIDEMNKQTQDLQAELYKRHHELDELKNRPANPNEVVEELEDKLKALDRCKRQLENDNQELVYKLSQALIECEQTEELLRREKDKNTSFLLAHEDHDTQPNVEIELLNQELDHSQNELQIRTAELNRLHNDMRTELARSEVTVSSLKLDLEKVKMDSIKSCDALSDSLEKSQQEIINIKDKLKKKEEDLTNNTKELANIQNQYKELEIQLDKEKNIQGNFIIKIKNLEDEILSLKGELQLKNTFISTLEAEKKKIHQELNQTLGKFSELEKKLIELQDESLRQKNMTFQSNDLLKENHKDKNEKKMFVNMEEKKKIKEEGFFTEELITSTHYLEEEKQRNFMDNEQLKSIHFQLEETLSQLNVAEHRAEHAQRLRQDLQQTRDETVHLRYQLQQEKLHRKLEQEQLQNLQQQFSEIQTREKDILRQNSELQHSLLDIQSKLCSMHDQTKSLTDKQHVTELGKMTLVEQINKLLKDTENLHLELISSREKNELQSRKYENLKIKHKIKMQRARDLFTTERSHLREAALQLEELSRTKVKLSQEVEWRERIEKDKKELILEKRQLLARLADNEELLREKKQELNKISIRIQSLEVENKQLNEKNDSLIKEVSYLHRTVKESRMEHQRQMFHHTTESLLSQMPSSNQTQMVKSLN